jgi:hypothetical protein
MNVRGVSTAIDAGVAMDWVRGSLAEGSALAMSMTWQLNSLTSAWLVAPDGSTLAPLLLDNQGRGIKTRDADLAAARFLACLSHHGDQILLVEDDLARRGDPRLDDEVAFVEDRVVRWSEIEADTSHAVALLRSGSSGYPLNAFVCHASARQLGLGPGGQIDDACQASIVESVDAVLVSVYDAEAYVALANADLISTAVEGAPGA